MKISFIARLQKSAEAPEFDLKERCIEWLVAN